MDIRNVVTRHLHISCIRFFIKCRADGSERWLDASWIDVHGIRGQIARNGILPVTAVCLWVILLIAALPVNPALARGTESRQKPRGNVWFLSTWLSKFGPCGSESRQKPGWMPHFCLPAGPNSGRAEPKVEQNLQNSEKCSTRRQSRVVSDYGQIPKSTVLPVTEVRCSDWANDAQHCLWQNHCRLRTNRWKWALCP